MLSSSAVQTLYQLRLDGYWDGVVPFHLFWVMDDIHNSLTSWEPKAILEVSGAPENGLQNPAFGHFSREDEVQSSKATRFQGSLFWKPCRFMDVSQRLYPIGYEIHNHIYIYICIYIYINVGHWLVKGGWLEESWAKIILPPQLVKGGWIEESFLGMPIFAGFWYGSFPFPFAFPFYELLFSFGLDAKCKSKACSKGINPLLNPLIKTNFWQFSKGVIHKMPRCLIM